MLNWEKVCKKNFRRCVRKGKLILSCVLAYVQFCFIAFHLNWLVKTDTKMQTQIHINDTIWVVQSNRVEYRRFFEQTREDFELLGFLGKFWWIFAIAAVCRPMYLLVLKKAYTKSPDN